LEFDSARVFIVAGSDKNTFYGCPIQTTGAACRVTYQLKSGSVHVAYSFHGSCS